MSDIVITADMIPDLVRYEPDTGRLFWKPRDVAMFPIRRVALAFNSTHAGREAFTATDSRGYKSGRIFDKTYAGHRVAWAAFYGEWPDVTDHINGDRTDNRIANLRNVSKAQNARNRRSDERKSLGVSFDAGRQAWRARVMFNYRDHHLGYFGTEIDAIAARAVALENLGFHPLHGTSK